MAASDTLVVILGILVHIIYLYSVFDIYFTSPLVHGMTPHKSSFTPPAKRLVLFVADGLRADKLYELDNENGQTRAPFLRDIMESTGRWGVSHTRVPTESRPGHVALIAGFYEDVSAVAKGWKENPVEFDSVFNQSCNTWSWGSPDILPMFAKGATGDHVLTEMYSAEQEDFAGEDNSKLDTWVFDKVEYFLKTVDKETEDKLKSDQNVFFLHLLGLDTNGHAHRPTSQEYMRNIETVDQGVKRMVDLFEKYFDDDKSTAYVLTSDHGMTNWGSHGAGNPHETLTPLVAWGAGVQGPEVVEYLEYDDGLSESWNLTHLKRCDVNQADIAPLMASLIGIPFPLNSVGVLPVEYLNNTELYKTDNLLTNARQILAQYQIKERMKKDTSLFFRQFQELTGSMQVGFLRNITSAMKAGHYEQAMIQIKRLTNLSLKGLNYYQNYDRALLSALVTLGFLGWIACVVLQVFHDSRESRAVNHTKQNTLAVNKIFLGIACVIVLLLMVENAPIMHYVYSLVALLCWNHVAKQQTLIYVFPVKWRSTLKLCLSLLLVLLGLELLVLSFFYRHILSLGLILLACWPLATSLRHTHVTTVALWVIHCLVLSCFPMFPVVGRDPNYLLVTLAGILTSLIVLIILLIYRQNQGYLEHRTLVVLVTQLCILGVAILVLNQTVYNLSMKKGLHRLNQFFSWLTILCAVILPILSSGVLVLRLVSTTLSLVTVYLLLSTSYEAFFMVTLSSTMAVWLVVEYQLLSAKHFTRDQHASDFTRDHHVKDLTRDHHARDHHTTSDAMKHHLLSQVPVYEPRDTHAKFPRDSRVGNTRDLHVDCAQDPRVDDSRKIVRVGDSRANCTQNMDESRDPRMSSQPDSRTKDISLDDLRCAFFFVFFIILGFFGTGNIASINTFDPSSLYCFVTVFSPFIMGMLLLFKVVIPFIVITCVFDAIHVVCHVPVNRLFLLVLVMTDLMALQFFYLVRDHGSWLEIGTSISHYVILLSFIIFLFLIFGVARFFTRTTWTRSDRKTHLQ